MFDEFFRTSQELMKSGRPFATATVVRAEKPTSGKPGDRAIVRLDGTMTGWIGGSCAQPTVVKEALEALADGESRLIRISPDPEDEPAAEGLAVVPMTCFSGGTLDVFIEPHLPRPRLLIVGNLPVAQALAHLGKAMNYDVAAFDPTESDAMEHADVVVRELDALFDAASPLSFVVVATHGEYEEPALLAALGRDVPYIGLVASRKRGAAVLERVAAMEGGEAAPDRIKFPAGLDILARRGDEIALSIMAEIVERRRSLERLGWEEEPAPQGLRVVQGTPATLLEASSSASGASGPAANAPPTTAKDPVCGMSVGIGGAVNTLEHGGRTYYFCCAGCRAAFEKGPDAYDASVGVLRGA